MHRQLNWMVKLCFVLLVEGPMGSALEARMSKSVGTWRFDRTILNVERHIVWREHGAERWYLRLFAQKSHSFLF